MGSGSSGAPRESVDPSPACQVGGRARWGAQPRGDARDGVGVGGERGGGARVGNARRGWRGLEDGAETRLVLWGVARGHASGEAQEEAGRGGAGVGCAYAEENETGVLLQLASARSRPDASRSSLCTTKARECSRARGAVWGGAEGGPSSPECVGRVLIRTGASARRRPSCGVSRRKGDGESGAGAVWRIAQAALERFLNGEKQQQ